MTIIGNCKRYTQFEYATEKDFEEEIVASSRVLFGKNTIYINAKKKVDSKSLGGAVPDGFFFDFTDLTDPQFYVVEVELSGHSFYNHIFPQITKFFAFFRNTKLQKSLVDKIFSVINTDDTLRNEFKKYLGQLEIYKFLSDIIESSQNILLIADGPIVELPEIIDTYTDTWGKMVRYLEVRKYQSGADTIYTITPDFETLQYEGDVEEIVVEIEDERPKYPESYHLEDVSQTSVEIYNQVKAIAMRVDSGLIFNPQKYYISIKAGRNIAFIKVRNKKIRLIVMMPEDDIRKYAKNHSVAMLSPPVQKFYNGPCAAVDIQNLEHMDEIETLVLKMIEYNKGSG
jgi:predicted transport protein